MPDHIRELPTYSEQTPAYLGINLLTHIKGASSFFASAGGLQRDKPTAPDAFNLETRQTFVVSQVELELSEFAGSQRCGSLENIRKQLT